MDRARGRLAALALTFALIAVASPSVLAAKKAPADPSPYWAGKSPEAAAAAILDAGKAAAGSDSWENIGIARVWYLAGQKERARPILEHFARPGTKEASDLYRIALIHCEAAEYELAQGLFERALALEPESDKTLVAMGACAMMAGQREKAEGFFRRTLQLAPENPWRYAAIGAAYLGVLPNLD